MRFRVWTMAVVLGGALACNVSVSIDPASQVTCTSPEDCPPGRVCVVAIGECREPASACIEQNGDTFGPVTDGNACILGGGGEGICNGGRCAQSECGDGILDQLVGSEECDNGTENSDFGDCLTDCTLAVCGDAFVQVGVEACDDGATSDNDGCAGDCSFIEFGWRCPIGASCEPFCGDGRLVGSETCDTGMGPTTGCTGCQADPGFVCVGEPSICSACGNNVVDGAEMCDDGGITPACDADCTFPVCGDDTLSPLAKEECEPAGAAHGTFTCQNCRVRCLAGFADCDADPVTGCECITTSAFWGGALGAPGDGSPTSLEDRGLSISAFADGSTVVLGVTVQDNPTFAGQAQSHTGPATFLARFDPDGGLTAAAFIDGGCTKDDACTVFADQATGDTLVLGRIQVGGATLECGTSCTDVNLTSRGEDDLFVARYDPDLELLWAQALGGPAADVPGGITTSTLGDVYVSGSVCAGSTTGACTAVIGAHCVAGASAGTACAMDGNCPGSTCGVPLTHGDGATTPAARAFVAQFSAAGAVRWAYAPDTDADVRTHSTSLVTTRDGGIVAAGAAEGPVEFNAPTPATTIPGMLVFKLDSAGAPQWGTVKPGFHEFIANSITETPNGNLVAAGSFIAPIDDVEDAFCVGGSTPGAACQHSNMPVQCPGGTCGGDTDPQWVVAWFTEAGAFQPTKTRAFQSGAGPARAQSISALPDNSVVVAGVLTGFTPLESNCYQGDDAGDDCGAGCPGGSCGHNAPLGGEGVAVLQFGNDSVLAWGEGWESSSGTSGSTGVTTFRDGSFATTGYFCRGTGTGACTLDFSEGPVLDHGTGDVEAFVKRLGAKP